MLIISHRGAAGLKPENTIAGLRAGMDSGADIIEFDVRLTKDGVPVLAHDAHTFRLNRRLDFIHTLTLKQLRKRTAGSDRPIATLEEALEECFGKIMLNIELKRRGSAQKVVNLLGEKYMKKPSDWESVILSSFLPGELRRARALNPHVPLAMLHGYNPFLFVAYHRQLNFTAVGFHRLYINQLALQIARKAHLFTYAYTVNRPSTAITLSRLGVDGVITDYPDKIIASLQKN